MIVLYIFLALLVFGFLIFIHELGHFIAARAFGVQIFEFSLGMGPKLVWYKAKKSGITYSLRMFPIGGFVSMLGEDSDGEIEKEHPDCDPTRSLGVRPAWQKLIVNAAGALMNLFFGFLVMTLIAVFTTPGSTTVAKLYSVEQMQENYGDELLSYTAGPSSEQDLAAGDEIIAVNGRRVHIMEELHYAVMHDGNEAVELTLRRNGEKITRTVTFPTITEQGQTLGIPDFAVKAEQKTFGNILKQSFYKSVYVVRMVWESIFDLLRGRYGVEAVSGPVGTAEVIVDAAKNGLYSLSLVAVVISVNLGIFNLLPLPALDGGHVMLNLIELITRKKVPPRYTAVIDAVGLLVLLSLIVLITCKDVTSLFKRG
ncbi:MAG: site-2 protease family protein [Clostridia bacterium]|nr:site-2 protease family protein [Clostridia bacterium]